MKKVEKWGMLELEFQGRTDGNPYTDYEIKAVFTGEKEKKEVSGFYDGNGTYKVRFMPSEEGRYCYEVKGNCFCDETEKSRTGELEVIKNSPDNHGPVMVKDKIYFAYADGKPYHSVGTTCYAWTQQPDEMQEQTLDTLSHTCFNKIRFCIFPKYYQYNEKEPVTYPYQRGQKRGQDAEKIKKQIRMSFPTDKISEDITDFDCYCFNAEHFRKIEQRIGQLQELGIEADIILFHPYDKWGFCTMKRECNELYMKYVIARFGAYRNVWWSLANEYDLTMSVSLEEWDRYGELIAMCDPYHHLRSIHNCMAFYDFTKEWPTHCSLQRTDRYKSVEETELLLKKYKKPVVWDEILYEGNIDMLWGNISAEELVRRFWEAVLRGGCAGHGETYVHPDDIVWWSHGGVLHGESEPRLAFLKKIWDEVPGDDLKHSEDPMGEVVAISKNDQKISSWMKTTWCEYELYYFGMARPSFKIFQLPEEQEYQIDIIDTWNMTIEDGGIHKGQSKIELPGREWMAIRLRKFRKKITV